MVRPHADGLAEALVRSLSDSDQMGALHQILGNFCHLVRNRLNCLKMSLYLAKRMELQVGHDAKRFEPVDHQYLTLERLIEHLQIICRPMTASPVRADLGEFFAGRREYWAERFERQGRRLEWNPPARQVWCEFDPSRLTQGFDELVSWRAEAGTGQSPVRFSWRAHDREVRVDWFEPEFAGEWEETATRPEPASLALPLLARILLTHGGRVRISKRKGFHLILRWPGELSGRDDADAGEAPPGRSRRDPSDIGLSRCRDPRAAALDPAPGGALGCLGLSVGGA